MDLKIKNNKKNATQDLLALDVICFSLTRRKNKENIYMKNLIDSARHTLVRHHQFGKRFTKENDFIDSIF
ncbi:hypothetical protein WL05_28435 [Burkholderia ubonensis]|uniref:Uncharacterized protein n=2 Tax=Burkholderia cepacia complex TaxID=87882 RepID=A0A1B4PRZ9_BURCE|nr:hypothetical protein WT26_12190 [Burkholderia cepacia]KVM16545.1 hypothetical protein WJ51_10700 [Burkholderia ubonensis]KVM19242.1 hypothetical protein WJ52_09555 [Burkholderia ubonensis]KVM49554.1 hypothetical protein WJ56_17710 [Burkholderia ubonensis]KVN79300.1 hypothetical protein WJ68_21585 [Burkholderia ubonensis]